MIATCALLSEIFLIKLYLTPDGRFPLITGNMFLRVMNYFVKS